VRIQTDKTPKQSRMVGWYDPGQLLRTGKEVVVSGLLGVRADYRLLESLAAKQDIYDDYMSEREIWIDYVADVGDGWDPTYTIASLLAAESLQVAPLSGPGESVTTERGRILIMGGDEVYPVANREAYMERTVGPFTSAFPERHPCHPDLFAIPGNHDWYDGLVSFTRLFCQGRAIGGWRTRQKRSYFALQLPHRWWLWGVDIQLESDIDQLQLEYFRKAAGKMNPGDRVILATAEPHWIYGNIYDPKLQQNLAFLEENIIGQAKAKLQVVLAGDLHHYRRHEATDASQVQLITSGGGGAFLHSTYGPPVEEIRVGAAALLYRRKAEFPSQEISRRLLRLDLGFLFLNPRFGLLTGVLYFLIGSALGPELQEDLSRLPVSAVNLFTALGFALRSAVGTLAGLLLTSLIVGGFISFTDTHKRAYRFLAGSLHAFANLLAVLLIGWVLVRSEAYVTNLARHSLPATIAIAVSLFLGGYIAGSCIMGLYLYVSLRFFRRHSNEAFSALHIPDYKNFLRLHIDSEGVLTIFPIGVVKIPRKWQALVSRKESDPVFVPAGAHTIDAGLIEEPIRVDSGGST
jgi:hypothetical protein